LSGAEYPWAIREFQKSTMIKIDASNVIPKRLGTYLLGIVPGLVFELSTAYSNPSLAHQVIDRVRQIYPFQGYALLCIFVVSCLIVGQTFYLLAWFADWLIDFLYRTQRYVILHLTLGSDWLYKVVGRLQGAPPKRNVRHLWRIIMWARQKKIPFEIRPVLKCQRMAATELLKRKYGVIPSKGQWEWVDQEWQAWLAVLGKAPVGFRETFLTMRTFLGCALAELAAIYTVPGLRNRYFVLMAGVLLAAGCFQSLSLARRRGEPIRSNLTRLLLLMEELAQAGTASFKEEKPPGGGPGITISTDNKQDDHEGE
jgi:hypothetical protein